MERKVFVHYYSEDPPKPGQRVTRTPVWKYYLREEEGESALCQLCDDEGRQTILKLKKGNGISPLHRHLRHKHSNVEIEFLPTQKQHNPGIQVRN